MFNSKTKTGKVYASLVVKGESLTQSEAKKRFGVGNLRAEATRLRQAGFAIYANEHKDTKGRVTVKYELGRPSRKLVAAGYRALAQSRA